MKGRERDSAGSFSGAGLRQSLLTGERKHIRWSGLVRGLRSRFSPPSANYDLHALRKSPYEFLEDHARVLDIGAKGRRGSYWPGAERLLVFNLDAVQTQGVDVLGDAHQIPFADNSIDAVLCISVLMYLENPQRFLTEARRVLRPGGILYLNSPWVYRTAPDGADLFRFSIDGLKILARDFEEVQSGFNRGPASTAADFLSHFLAMLTCFNSMQLYGVLQGVYQWMIFPLKYLDRWVACYDCAGLIYSGAFYLGMKPRSEAR